MHTKEYVYHQAIKAEEGQRRKNVHKTDYSYVKSVANPLGSYTPITIALKIRLDFLFSEFF